MFRVAGDLIATLRSPSLRNRNQHRAGVGAIVRARRAHDMRKNPGNRAAFLTHSLDGKTQTI